MSDVIDRFRRWVASDPALPALDAQTEAFCRRRLRESADLLARKVELELGDRRHVPLGRVLVVIAEHDVLGTVAGLVAATITGNRVRIKARTTRALVEDVVRALAIADCEVLDWDSRDDDDHLDGIDGVLLAGGDALIRRYRRATQPGVRLIEFGPKLSCAAIGQGADLARVADALVTDVTLFGQGVCSSPQWILVEDPAIASHLRDRLAACGPLAEGDRLIQLVRAQELRLLGRLGEPIEVAVDPRTGWGVMVSHSLGHRLPRGFAVVVGPLAGQLAAVAQLAPHGLQTLGVAGRVPAAPGFTHRCPIGRMHERSILEPHDGMLELAALVHFVSEEP